MDTCICICIYSGWILAALYCIQAAKMQETSRQLPGSRVCDMRAPSLYRDTGKILELQAECIGEKHAKGDKTNHFSVRSPASFLKASP